MLVSLLVRAITRTVSDFIFGSLRLGQARFAHGSLPELPGCGESFLRKQLALFQERQVNQPVVVRQKCVRRHSFNAAKR